jgi:hypothetical protein
MRKMIETAALGLSLCLAGLGIVTYVQAQDPEEGAVDLNETSKPAPEPRGAPAWESPPREGGFDNEDVRSGSGAKEEEEKVKEPGPGKLRLYGGARLGVGGGFKPKGFKPGLYSAAPTPGAQLGADYLLIKYFSLGLETRLSWIKQESSGAKYMLFDLLLKPRAVYRVKAQPIEVYLAVPGGLTVLKPDQKWEKGHPSASVGVFGGATYFFTDAWALNAELGFNWTFMRFKTVVQMPGPPGTGVAPIPVPAEAKVRFGQLTLLAVNLTYAF